MSRSRANRKENYETISPGTTEIPDMLRAIRSSIFDGRSEVRDVDLNEFIDVLEAAALSQPVSKIQKESYLHNQDVLRVQAESIKPNYETVHYGYTLASTIKVNTTAQLFSLLNIIQRILTNTPLDPHALDHILQAMYFHVSIAQELLFEIVNRKLVTPEMLAVKNFYLLSNDMHNTHYKELTAYQAYLQSYDLVKAIYINPMALHKGKFWSSLTKDYAVTNPIKPLFDSMISQIMNASIEAKDIHSLSLLYDAGFIDLLDPVLKQRTLNACLQSDDLKQAKFSEQCHFISVRAPHAMHFSVSDQLLLNSPAHFNYSNTKWIASYIEHFSLQAMKSADKDNIDDILSYFLNAKSSGSAKKSSFFKYIPASSVVDNPLAKFFPKSFLKGETHFTDCTSLASWRSFVDKLTQAYHHRFEVLTKEERSLASDKDSDAWECDFSVLNRSRGAS